VTWPWAAPMILEHHVYKETWAKHQAYNEKHDGAGGHKHFGVGQD